jgi:hypothetical protein
VVDYDATAERFNGTHVLPRSVDREPKRWQLGDRRIVKDYRFHAQNVYAYVMRTLARFEFALGRRVGWSSRSFKSHQLKIAPHGMCDANAFYSPHEEGLVFGYFSGSRGGVVYTCLSHDIAVHETTHALIDALRERYMDPSSPDQAAFHEGLADVVALLSVFSLPEVLRHLLSGGRVSKATPELIGRRECDSEALRKSALFGLAEEMGQETQTARGGALRHSATLPRDATLLTQPEFLEPHRRGEVFAAAVMNGFVEAWADRILKLGIPGQRKYPLQRVAEEGADIADVLITMWIRAIDYMPPVHLEFRDALSAALTADAEVRPNDSRYELRKRMLEAFRMFGIDPASTTPGVAGAWQRAPAGLKYGRVRAESLRTDKDEVFRFLWDNREALKLREGAYARVLSVRPCVRQGPDGFMLRETIAEYYQVARLTVAELRQRGVVVPAEYADALRAARQGRAGEAVSERRDLDREEPDEDLGTTPLYGGGTLVFDEYGHLKFHIYNDVYGAKRQTARLQYLWDTGQLEAGGDSGRLRIERLASLHRMRVGLTRRPRAEGW